MVRLNHVSKPWTRESWEKARPFILEQRQKLETSGWAGTDSARTELYVLRRNAPTALLSPRTASCTSGSPRSSSTSTDPAARGRGEDRGERRRQAAQERSAAARRTPRRTSSTTSSSGRCVSTATATTATETPTSSSTRPSHWRTSSTSCNVCRRHGPPRVQPQGRHAAQHQAV